jgi:hypothetical protein
MQRCVKSDRAWWSALSHLYGLKLRSPSRNVDDDPMDLLKLFAETSSAVMDVVNLLRHRSDNALQSRERFAVNCQKVREVPKSRLPL